MCWLNSKAPFTKPAQEHKYNTEQNKTNTQKQNTKQTKQNQSCSKYHKSTGAKPL
jgi:hypothetical protein